MVDNRTSSMVLDSGALLDLVINYASYMSVGLISFKFLENVTRDRGLLVVY